MDGGVDLLLPETSFDTLNMKSCLFAIAKVFAEERNHEIPVMISGSQSSEGGVTSAGPDMLKRSTPRSEHFPSLSVGFNCALGPRADQTVPADSV